LSQPQVPPALNPYWDWIATRPGPDQGNQGNQPPVRLRRCRALQVDVHAHGPVHVDQGARDHVDPLVFGQVADERVARGVPEQQSPLLGGEPVHVVPERVKPLPLAARPDGPPDAPAELLVGDGCGRGEEMVLDDVDGLPRREGAGDDLSADRPARLVP
jgi:hypothetical protein